MDIIQDSAGIQGFTRVRRVAVSVGRGARVAPELLAFAFESVAAGTLAEGAALEIRERPGTELRVDYLDVL